MVSSVNHRVRPVLVFVMVLATAFAGCLADGPDDAGDTAPNGRFSTADRPAFTEGRAVVAVVDTGANPYHETFRRESRTWTAVETLWGYPADARTLPLTFDADDQQAALEADAPLWDLVEERTLYDVPGTAFAGLIAFGQPAPSEGAPARAPGLDEVGHGTAAAGMVAQACPDCLLVAVEVAGATEGRHALDWLSTQTWIDVVVYPARAGAAFIGAGAHGQDAVDASEFQWARQNAEAGQVVVVAAGNGHSDLTGTGAAAYGPLRDLSYGYWTAGPDWVVTVGAAAADKAEATTWHTFPVDIIAPGLDCAAPHPFTMDDPVAFEGTSCSAPLVAGQMGAVLAATRDALHDGATGPRSGQRLVVPDRAETPAVTREDLTRAYLLAAGPLAATDLLVSIGAPTEPKSWSTGDGALSPLYAGWGLHDPTSLAEAVAVLTGARAAPVPDDEQAAWFPVDQRLRLELWGDWDRGESRVPFPAPYGGAVKVPVDATGLEALYAAATDAP